MKRFAVHIFVFGLVTRCTHIGVSPARSPADFEKHFSSLQAMGVKSVRCEVHFSPLKILVRMLERSGQISAADSKELRQYYGQLTLFTDGTPCLIQQKARPRIHKEEDRKTIEQFADVALAATHGSCQMLNLGYLRPPIDFALAREKWQKTPSGDWLLNTIEGGGQQILIRPDLTQIEIRQERNEHPFVLQFTNAENLALPTEVNGYLEGQGPLNYTATFEFVKGVPVPLTTALVIKKPGKDRVRMALEYSNCIPEI